MLPNQDDNHAKYFSPKGARVGVGWMPMMDAFWPENANSQDLSLILTAMAVGYKCRLGLVQISARQLQV